MTNSVMSLTMNLIINLKYNNKTENVLSFLFAIYKKMEITKFNDSLIDLIAILEVMKKNRY